jgi:tRNA modification GTPase
MRGALGNRAENWRGQLIQALALVEARIDFSDEADVPQDLVTPALQIARALGDEIASVLADGGRGERLREGLVVAIAGPPNAGKSTLLNRIAKREAAIVSPHAGTTRDVIEVHLDLSGLPVTLLDTAGIRETHDPVELEGVRRARERANAADLVLWVVDPSDGANPPLAVQSSSEKPAVTAPVWVIRNKIDLARRSERGGQSYRRNESSCQVNKPSTNVVNERLAGTSEFGFSGSEPAFDLSAKSGEGFDALLEQLTKHAETYLVGAESALVTRERHRRALEDVVAALRRASRVDRDREDLLAEELRIAAQSLGRLTGRVDVEDVLDVIFRDFCIGK